MAKTTIHQLSKVVGVDTSRPADIAEEIIWSFLDVLARTLAAGDSLTVSNFGTFTVRERSGHKGRNIQTGDIVELPTQTVASFRATGRLREMVRDGDTTASIRKLPKS